MYYLRKLEGKKLTKIEPGTTDMSKVTPRALDVGHCENIQLRLVCSSSGIDRKQDRPCDTAANQTRNHRELEEAEEKV